MLHVAAKDLNRGIAGPAQALRRHCAGTAQALRRHCAGTAQAAVVCQLSLPVRGPQPANRRDGHLVVVSG